MKWLMPFPLHDGIGDAASLESVVKVFPLKKKNARLRKGPG